MLVSLYASSVGLYRRYRSVHHLSLPAFLLKRTLRSPVGLVPISISIDAHGWPFTPVQRSSARAAAPISARSNSNFCE
eukprot:4641049-Pleurochrysis_carterae.AAC.2